MVSLLSSRGLSAEAFSGVLLEVMFPEDMLSEVLAAVALDDVLFAGLLLVLLDAVPFVKSSSASSSSSLAVPLVGLLATAFKELLAAALAFAAAEVDAVPFVSLLVVVLTAALEE